jgi:UDP-N-acetyl-D-mannosaminuronic acid dehydrogenase
MKSPYKNVCVLGMGYIGLPTAAVFANRGVEVLGVDVRPDIVELINKGKIHIEEPGLGVAVQAAVSSGNLKAYSQPQPADAYILAVPTPFKDGKQPDLSFVDAAAESVALVVQKGNLVILESTSPPGTTERVAEIVAKRTGRPSSDFYFAHCPERVLPGRTMEELVSNDHIIGGVTPEAASKARELYSIFVQGQILLTDARTAELTKLMENTYRDVNIALANELSMICDKLGVNVWDCIRLANHHPRVKILSPGPGVGGHCIAVDPWFIVAMAPTEAKLIRTAREVNDSKPHFVEQRIIALAEQHKAGKAEVLLLGLTYKPDVDDFRGSPSMQIADSVSRLLGNKAVVHDPYLEKYGELPGHMNVAADFEKALSAAKIVVLLVDHKAYKQIPINRLTGKTIIDTRGTWSTVDSKLD